MATGKSVKKTEIRKRQQIVFVIEYRTYIEDVGDIGGVLESISGYAGYTKVVDVKVEEEKDA